jgi:hypothetical protein
MMDALAARSLIAAADDALADYGGAKTTEIFCFPSRLKTTH